MSNLDTTLREKFRQWLNKRFADVGAMKIGHYRADEIEDHIVEFFLDEFHQLMDKKAKKVKRIKADGRLISSDPNENDEYISKKQVLSILKD